jgi:hypothetical protein
MWRGLGGERVRGMPTTSTHTSISATAVREQLVLLQRERAAAALEGVVADDLYLTDLLDEIAQTRDAYIGAAVTEIASLRAVLDGPLLG